MTRLYNLAVQCAELELSSGLEFVLLGSLPQAVNLEQCFCRTVGASEPGVQNFAVIALLQIKGYIYNANYFC